MWNSRDLTRGAGFYLHITHPSLRPTLGLSELPFSAWGSLPNAYKRAAPRPVIVSWFLAEGGRAKRDGFMPGESCLLYQENSVSWEPQPVDFCLYLLGQKCVTWASLTARESSKSGFVGWDFIGKEKGRMDIRQLSMATAICINSLFLTSTQCAWYYFYPGFQRNRQRDVI